MMCSQEYVERRILHNMSQSLFNVETLVTRRQACRHTSSWRHACRLFCTSIALATREHRQPAALPCRASAACCDASTAVSKST